MTPADTPAIVVQPDGTVLLIYPCGRRLEVLADGQVPGLSLLERLALRVLLLIRVGKQSIW